MMIFQLASKKEELQKARLKAIEQKIMPGIIDAVNTAIDSWNKEHGTSMGKVGLGEVRVRGEPGAVFTDGKWKRAFSAEFRILGYIGSNYEWANGPAAKAGLELQKLCSRLWKESKIADGSSFYASVSAARIEYSHESKSFYHQLVIHFEYPDPEKWQEGKPPVPGGQEAQPNRFYKVRQKSQTGARAPKNA